VKVYDSPFLAEMNAVLNTALAQASTAATRRRVSRHIQHLDYSRRLLSNAWGSATSGPVTLTVLARVESIPPKVIILTPKTGWETDTNVITVNGTALDAAPGPSRACWCG